ncbi:hypothetical protein AB0D98_30530, partial [Streptomyces sp. NPDC047987]
MTQGHGVALSQVDGVHHGDRPVGAARRLRGAKRALDWDIAPLPAPEGVTQAPIGDDRCDLLVPEGH